MIRKKALAVWFSMPRRALAYENNLFRWFLHRGILPRRWLIEWNASLNIRTIKLWDGSYRDLPAAKGNALAEEALNKGNALVDKLRQREQERGNL